MAAAPGAVLWSDSEYEIRPARNTDEFRDWWWSSMQTLGWGVGYYDLDTFMNPSSGYGMLLLIEKSSRQPVGHVSAVINSNSTGWVSMFVVDEKHRGKGLGRELFKAAEADFDRCGTKIRGLDGVAEQKQTYERRQFVASPLGTVKQLVRPLIAAVPISDNATSNNIIDIRKVPKALLAQSEEANVGIRRPDLWSDEHLFNREDVHGVAVVNIPDPIKLNDLRAWTVTRRYAGGVKIGPLYASDKESARAALIAAMDLATPDAVKRTDLPNSPMNQWTLDKVASEARLAAEVWSGNSEAIELFEELGWVSAGYEYYRMWFDGKAPLEQSDGGAAARGAYAFFDAATG
ncbi:hypothetical protein DOTSEDRAFT_74487 [Dothistroma septosporum NZE10]|uniref:N-acetyltransferase domain-containing protein n=1 Tax=Dothistroma septosporum (strain NZE10 / CBS 128990) TaxID=675120 RepID=N1PEA0_DOTSN|nr:hypothetical protein DOTSEDRAFT_74487 [Dothistroma septosporum NZE10]